jgi:prophage regulatory protein
VSGHRIIRLPELIDRTGMSRTRIYASMGDGTFPASVKLGARAVGWREGEVDAWIAGLPSARTSAGEPTTH